MITTTNVSDDRGIVLSGLSKSYDDVPAVRGIDLCIARGEAVALLGPNGAGKSTMIDMLLGLTRPDSGSVSLFGMSPRQAIAEGAVGGMLQAGSLIPYLRVRELVGTVAALYPHALEVEDALALSGCRSFAARFTTRLSGGQAQRVRLAIALVGDPDLLVLDEPTAALDVEARRDFSASIRGLLGRGKTVIFATHHLEEADAHADRIVFVARGQIVADGSATEIRARVGGRTIRATLPDADEAALRALPAVTGLERHGDSMIISCSDPEDALRALLQRFPAARDVEVRGVALDDVFLALTTAGADGGHSRSERL